MAMRGARWLIPLAIGLGAAGCSITTHVEPLPPGTTSAVCIKENPETWSEEFLPTLQGEFERHGIKTTTYADDKPADCRYHVEYNVNWSWDMAVYLEFADIQIFEDQKPVARATYDARHGSGRLDKFGTTAEKLARLMDQLLGGSSAGG